MSHGLRTREGDDPVVMTAEERSVWAYLAVVTITSVPHLAASLTVVASIGSLMLRPRNTFAGIGIAIIAVALAAMSITLFLLPAVLRLPGHRVSSWRLPMRQPGETSRGWTRLATWVARRPGAAAGLVMVMPPVLSPKFAMPRTDSWPDDFVLHKANAACTEDFRFTDAATMVAVTGGTDAQITASAYAIETDAGFAGTTVDARDGAVFIDTHEAFDVTDPASGEAVEPLRDGHVRRAPDGRCAHHDRCPRRIRVGFRSSTLLVGVRASGRCAAGRHHHPDRAGAVGRPSREYAVLHSHRSRGHNVRPGSVRDAMERVASRHARGKVVVSMP